MIRRNLPAPLTVFAALSSVAALVLAAGCHRDRKGASAAAVRAAEHSEAVSGPDPILIRIPRAGGTARAYRYPRLDSAVWSGRTTPVTRVLGFDPDGGTLLVVDAKGRPVRLDLRMGEASLAASTPIAELTAGTGSTVYGVNSKGAVVQLARSGMWSFTPPAPARGIFPQVNGTVLIAGQRGRELEFWRMYPPDTRLRDTVTLRTELTAHTPRAQVGDRVYIATDTGLVGVRAPDLTLVPTIRVSGRVAALAPTPSGDRLYVAIEGKPVVDVIDRYTNRVARHITLPGQARELRMDPLGRYVLVRPARGDSAWVIAVATDRVEGSVATHWTGDLPAAAPDGAIALNGGRDVVFVDGETLQRVRTVAGGASDFWYFTFWNGFRPHLSAEAPASFASADSGKRSDSAAAATVASRTDTSASARAPAATGAPPAAPATAPPPPAPAAVTPSAAAPAATVPAPPSPPAPHDFTVSFAALLDGAKAQALADSITVAGQRARVVPVERAGATVYRVVLGPYSTHAAADAAGRASGRTYWVFGGPP